MLATVTFYPTTHLLFFALHVGHILIGTSRDISSSGKLSSVIFSSDNISSGFFRRTEIISSADFRTDIYRPAFDLLSLDYCHCTFLWSRREVFIANDGETHNLTPGKRCFTEALTLREVRPGRR